jgi:hypothetical protein
LSAYIFVPYCRNKNINKQIKYKMLQEKKKKKKEVFTSEMTETQPATHKGTIMQQSVK